MANRTVNPVQALIGAGIFLGFLVYLFGGGVERQAARDMERIEQQVADDAVKQYEIAKRNGTAIDACVHAGMVAAAYIQAKDEPSYRRWKDIEATDCSKAGVPR